MIIVVIFEVLLTFPLLWMSLTSGVIEDKENL